ncbi:MAG: lamin tail domain-containing protein [Bacteroidota bacterium]|nr:lamin tail domain-containing protein [Bacteroidota bacterium]
MDFKKLILIVLGILFGSNNYAQVADDFTDGNYNANPVWLGDDSLFFVNANFQLQSKGTVGSSKEISLVTESKQNFGGEWSCWLCFALNPSTQNYCRYYLCSDQANLKGALNGYYVQLGGSTGNTDTISLYKQNGLNRTRMIAGRAGTITKTNNVVQLKILCDSLGNWQLYSDTSALGNYILEGSAFDSTFTTSVYTGFFAKFTTGNISNFYFDDLYAGPQKQDTLKPMLIQFEVSGKNKIIAGFSEKMDETALLNTNNYKLDQTYNPSQILNSTSFNSVELLFSDSFISGSAHSLQISGLKDKNNNMLKDTQVNFTFYIPQKNDILISELMPDPDPSQGLPDAEYIELYNNSKFPLNLKNWKLKDMSSSVFLPDFIILPDSFMIVCESQFEYIFKSFGQTLGISSLPSLNNSGDKIELQNEVGIIINGVDYDLGYFHHPVKQNGGWSLELTNPNKLCTGIENWQASNNTKGGTPGKINSNWQNFTDSIAPHVLLTQQMSATSIEIFFDEPIDSSLSASAIQIGMNPQIAIQQIHFNKYLSKSLEVEFQTPLMHLQLYQMQMDYAFDCASNQITQSSEFVYVEEREPRQNQLLINEIMFAPSTATAMPDAEFIELLNSSNYVIRLKDYVISDGSARAFFPDVLLYPDSFLLLCSNSDKMLLDKFGKVLGLNDFPSLGSEEQLTLYNNNGYILHQVLYNETFLNNKIKQQFGGWTLEMKDSKNPCGFDDNWESCMNPKGGTPGSVNSIKQMNPDRESPHLLRVYPTDNNHLQCIFSETIDSMGAGNLNLITLSNNLHPVSYRYCNVMLNQIEFIFTKAFDTFSIYHIRMDSIVDCAGNLVSDENNADFGMPHKADSGDVIINEVLFNPYLNGYDFVELFNRSEKYIDVNPFLLARFDENFQVAESVHLGGKGWIIGPKQYLAITENIPDLLKIYPTPNRNQILENKLPPMNDDAGSIILINSSGKIYDQFIYSEKMHFELLTNTEGVSLERINPFRNSNDPTNWASASSNNAYATPAYRNSQFTVTKPQGSFNIDPEVFSPDGDGYKDILTFTYKLGSNSNLGKIEIYNSSGNRVKLVCNNYYLGTQGEISWNGITDNGAKALTGVYIAHFEVFNLQGETYRFQKTFVVGGN